MCAFDVVAHASVHRITRTGEIETKSGVSKSMASLRIDSFHGFIRSSSITRTLHYALSVHRLTYTVLVLRTRDRPGTPRAGIAQSLAIRRRCIRASGVGTNRTAQCSVVRA